MNKYGNKVYAIQGIEMIHIAEAANLWGLCKPWIRHMIEEGNTVRKMKFYRDRSRLMIPVAEIEGYPFTERGKQTLGTTIYHYRFKDGKWERYVCEKCTYTDKQCDSRRKAEELVVPKGDD